MGAPNSNVTPAATTPDEQRLRRVLAAHMDRHGLRHTEQRNLIVDEFFRRRGHASIEDLLAVVRSEDRRIGYATVYRTLKLLVDCGVAHERQFGDGLTRFELADDESHHDHIICLQCGHITEFQVPEVEALQDRIAAEHGFRVRNHKHELYADCQRENCPNRKPSR